MTVFFTSFCVRDDAAVISTEIGHLIAQLFVFLLLSDLNDTLSDNDTVGHIVHYIMKNEGVFLTGFLTS